MPPDAEPMPLHFLVTQLDAGEPHLLDLTGTPENGGWCFEARPLDGSPPFDFWVPLPGGTMLRYLTKRVLIAQN